MIVRRPLQWETGKGSNLFTSNFLDALSIGHWHLYLGSNNECVPAPAMFLAFSFPLKATILHKVFSRMLTNCAAVKCRA
jgi:hypothetical protein